MKTFFAAVTAAALLSAPAFAGPGKGNDRQGNSGQAQDMAGGLQGNRGAASVAADVSGKGAPRGESGWGNVGSSLDDGNSVSGKISN